MIGDLLRIAAPDIRRIPPLTAFKPGDQSVAGDGTSTVTADTDLYLDLEADSTYRFLLTLYYSGANITGGFSTPEPLGMAGAWTLTQSVMAYNTTIQLFTVVNPAITSIGYEAASAAAMASMIFAGTVHTTNAGTLQFVFAPWEALGNSGYTVTVKTGSELDAWKTG